MNSWEFLIKIMTYRELTFGQFLDILWKWILITQFVTPFLNLAYYAGVKGYLYLPGEEVIMPTLSSGRWILNRDNQSLPCESRTWSRTLLRETRFKTISTLLDGKLNQIFFSWILNMYRNKKNDHNQNKKIVHKSIISI